MGAAIGWPKNGRKGNAMKVSIPTLQKEFAARVIETRAVQAARRHCEPGRPL